MLDSISSINPFIFFSNKIPSSESSWSHEYNIIYWWKDKVEKSANVKSNRNGYENNRKN